MPEVQPESPAVFREKTLIALRAQRSVIEILAHAVQEPGVDVLTLLKQLQESLTASITLLEKSPP